MDKNNKLYILIFLIAILSALALSWLLTCGLVKAISVCFSFEFSWKIATGIWCVIMLLRLIFGRSGKN
jgi:hypothetical protein